MQVLDLAFKLAYTAQACRLAAAWHALQHSCERRPRQAQILRSRFMPAHAAQACGLTAASLAQFLDLTLTLANAAQACRLAAALRARRLVDRPRRASDPRVALHDR